MGNMTKMVCPKCGGRVFDISKIPKERIDVALKNNFGFGGTNGSLVFKRV